MKTPIIFIIFNRPDTTRIVFEKIKEARPEHLYIVADGPRPHKEGEDAVCKAVRAIVEKIDWPCTVTKDYSEINLGCKKRVSSGITNAFKLFESAIILEDDCVPSKSFFTFMEEMLNRYKDEEQVILVSGDNRLFGKTQIQESYYFSRYLNIWGWATWRRAWKKYDIEMKDWPKIKKEKILSTYFNKKSEQYYWESMFDYAYKGRMNTWDYQWAYTSFLHNGLAIVPEKNLIQNIGFDAAATHTKSGSIWESLMAEELTFPLTHPKEIKVNTDLDAIEQGVRIKNVGMLPYPLNKIKDLVRDFLGK